MKKIILMVLTLTMLFCFTACKDNPVESGDKSGEEIVTSKYSDVKQNPIVTMEMENGDVVKIELYPKIAPITVENFISLINQGFYDGLTFHRVIPKFMAQGGDPSGDGTGGPGYTIKGEFKENGVENTLSHEVGVISMARTQDPNGAGSQFFIVTDEMSYLSLDGLYAAFGKVVEGMDAVNTIVNAEVIRTAVDDDVLAGAYEAISVLNAGGVLTEAQEQALNKYYEQAKELDRPIEPPTIKTMTVDTFGIQYDEPDKITK